MYRTDFGRVVVKDADNLTFEEKLNMLKGFLFRKKSCEFKLIAFIAAARSDDYLVDLKPFPAGFITPTGENHIEGLRQLILQIPNVNEILDRILNNQINSLNPKVIKLLFWLNLNIPHIIDEPVEELLHNRHIMFDFPSEIEPLGVFAIEGRAKKRFREYCVENNITPTVAYFNCYLNQVYNILINNFVEEQTPSVILKKSCNPEQSFCEAVWDKSECFSKIRCIVMCSLLPSSSHIESYNDNLGEYVEVVDKKTIYVERFILYPDDGNAETTLPWFKDVGYIMVYTSMTALLVAALLRKFGSNPIVHRFVSKCMGTLHKFYQ